MLMTRWKAASDVLTEIEEKSNRAARVLSTAVGDLDDKELQDLLDLRRVISERLPTLHASITNAQKDLESILARLTHLAEVTRVSNEPVSLRQLVERTDALRNAFEGFTASDAKIIEGLQDRGQTDPSPDPKQQVESPNGESGLRSGNGQEAPRVPGLFRSGTPFIGNP
jgi:hypothetical protein